MLVIVEKPDFDGWTEAGEGRLEKFSSWTRALGLRLGMQERVGWKVLEDREAQSRGLGNVDERGLVVR